MAYTHSLRRSVPTLLPFAAAAVMLVAMLGMTARAEEHDLPGAPAVASEPPPLECAGIGSNAFFGCYYDNITGSSPSVVIDDSSLKLTRTDAAINFNWGSGSPDPIIGPDTFAVVWEGDWSFSSAGTYRFTMTTDDGMRAFVNGTKILDSWKNQAATTYTSDISLPAGTHRIKIEYYENTGNAVAQFSWGLIETVDTTPPSIPTLNPLQVISTSQIDLSWTASSDPESGVASYNLYRCSGSSACAPALYKNVGNVTSYSDTGLAAGTIYRYQVSAINGTGLEGGKSNAESAATQSLFDFALSASPSSVSVVQGNAVSDTITATLLSGASETVTFQSPVGLPSNSTYSYSQTSCLPSCESVLTITTSASIPANTYTISVSASGGGLTRSASFTLTVEQAPDTTPPAAITDLAAMEVRQRSADLRWTAPGDDGNAGTASAYDMRISTAPITEFNWATRDQLAGEPAPSPAGSMETYTIVGLKKDTTYYVAVKTIDDAGNVSALSNVLSLKTARTGKADAGQSRFFASLLFAQADPDDNDDTTPPANVANFTARGAHNQIVLTWTNPTDEDYVRTLIVRKEGSAPSSRHDGVAVYEGQDTAFTDRNLNAHATYYYTAYTFDRVPNYSAGATVSASPMGMGAGASMRPSSAPPAPPAAPSGGMLSRGFFTRLLARGVKDNDVRHLQQFLIRQGHLEDDNDTGYFGPLTEEALKQFQCKHGIVCDGNAQSTGWGLFGPKTRAKANELWGGAAAKPPTPSSLTEEQRQQLIQSLRQQMESLLRAVEQLRAQQTAPPNAY